MNKGPRHLKSIIDKAEQTKDTFKSYFDFGNAFEDALNNPQTFQFDYGFVAKQPDASGKYATYGRIIAEAVILQLNYLKSNGLPLEIDTEWLFEVKKRAHEASTLAGDIEKADKELEKEPYKTYFGQFIAYEGRVTDSETWALLQELIGLASQNETFQKIMRLPYTDQEVLTWTVNVDGNDIKCKGISDRISIDIEDEIIYLMDMKTTTQNLYDGSFQQKASEYGYHNQLFGYALGIKQHPEYSKLIEKGYTIQMLWAVGVKSKPASFALVPFTFEWHSYEFMMDSLVSMLRVFLEYKENDFKEPDWVKSI